MFRSYDIAEFSGIRFKPYTIEATEGESINIKPVLDYAKSLLAESAIPWLRHCGLGYITYHKGEDGNWLLLRTWVEGGIQAGLIAANHGQGFQLLKVPFCECVWEAVIATHERDAWVRHMMCSDQNPEAYLEDRLSAGFY